MSDEDLPGDEILRRKFGTVDIVAQDTLSDAAVRFIETVEFFFIATSMPPTAQRNRHSLTTNTNTPVAAAAT